MDAGPVVEHLQYLVSLGATRKEIAKAAGCSTRTVQYLLTGGQSQTFRDTAERILGVRWEASMVDTHTIPSLGSRRRLQGLVAMGHDMRPLIGACRISRNTATELLYNRLLAVWPSTADRIEAGARRLILTPGDSGAAMERAHTHGWVPLAAWDDIDDPAEQPSLGRRSDRSDRTRAIVEDTAELLARGLSREEIAKRVGIRWDSIMVAHARAGVRLEVAS